MKITRENELDVSDTINKCTLIFCVIMFLFIESGTGQIVNGSFETVDGQFSTAGWRNWGGLPCGDTPPGGGNWSLEFQSGCVWEYCSQYIPGIKDGDIFEISCWAKITAHYGGGELFWSDNQRIAVTISDTNWTYISVIDTLEMMDNPDSVFFFLSGGGGIAGTGGACFDLVELHKIGNTTSINAEESSPNEFHLYQNYPNPFNPKTVITFTLPRPGIAKLEIYNAVGQKISVLLNSNLPGGSHQVEFDGRNLISGIYFYKLEAGSFQKIRKMVLVK